jgi:hypothetical protein
LEVYWAFGLSGWMDVVSSIFLKASHDVGIIAGCSLCLLINRVISRRINISKTPLKKLHHFPKTIP